MAVYTQGMSTPTDEDTMRTVTIEVPEELAAELDKYESRAGELLHLGLTQLKVHEALYLYGRSLVTIARAAEIAGVHRQEMIRHARAAGVEPRYSEEMSRDELA